MLKKQREFAFGFFDCESQQCTEREDGEFEYGEHVVTTISLCKVRRRGPTFCVEIAHSLDEYYSCRFATNVRMRPLISSVLVDVVNGG